MLLDLSKDVDLRKFMTYVEYLAEKGHKVDIKKINHKRTINQNKYLHVCISLFAIEYGYTLEEAKTYLKRMCDFMVYEKNGQKFLLKTSKMDTSELTKFIEWVRSYAGMQGLYIPTSEEYLTNWMEVEKEIEKYREYL